MQLVSVKRNTMAGQIGFRGGDLIQQVNGKPTRTVDDLRTLTEAAAGKGVTFTYTRGQQEKTLNIK